MRDDKGITGVHVRDSIGTVLSKVKMLSFGDVCFEFGSSKCWLLRGPACGPDKTS